MGLDGGEKLKFHIAGKTATDKDKVKNGNVSSPSVLFKDKKFALVTEEVTLENDWLPFSVDLTKVPKEQLTGVTFPFAIETSKIKGEQEFYIKAVTYDTEPAENPLATTAEELVVTPLSTEISGNATSREAPMTVELGSNTTGGIEPYVDPRWEFGDDEEGEGANVSHTYSEPGEYNVTFTVADSGSQTASDSLIVLVTEPEAEPEQQQEVPTDGQNVTGNDDDSSNDNNEDDSSSTTESDTDNGVQQEQQSEAAQEGNSTQEEDNESP
jgi:PKD repeat protein